MSHIKAPGALSRARPSPIGGSVAPLRREPTSMETTTSPGAELERGFRLEQAGNAERALEAYQGALSSAVDPLEKVEARVRIARVLRNLARWDESTAESRRAVTMAIGLSAHDLAAEAMNVELGVLQRRGAFREAYDLGEAALQHAKSPRVRGITLQNLGATAGVQGDFRRADEYIEQSAAAFREAGYELGVAIALSNQSIVARELGEAERSIELSLKAIAICRRLNALDALLTAVQNQAHALAMLGRFEEAEEMLTEALGHFVSAQNAIGQAECLEILGELAERRTGNVDTARRCYQRARDIADRAGATVLAERLERRLTPVGH